jgi:ribonuclease HI
VFRQGGEVIAECSGGEAHTTNNQMELTAVREAVRRAPGNVIVEIVTDSKLVVGWLCQGWKRKEPKNAALCAEIDALRALRASVGSDEAGNVTFTHVLGHNGNALNERADHLATEAIKQVRNGSR